jgi:hypothetical protein
MGIGDLIEHWGSNLKPVQRLNQVVDRYEVGRAAPHLRKQWTIRYLRENPQENV